MDWATHFRKISASADFGSILGQQSVADLKDLIAAQDNSIAQLQKHFDETPAENIAQDTDLLSDWNALKARYTAARGDAQAIIDLNVVSVIPDSATPAQSNYDEVLKALKQSYPTLSVTKGDLQDIFNRFPFDMSPLPQPVASDVDLNTFKVLDSTTRSMPSFVKTAIATLTPGLVPKTVDQSSYKPISKTAMIITGIAVVAGIVLVGKAVL